MTAPQRARLLAAADKQHLVYCHLMAVAEELEPGDERTRIEAVRDGAGALETGLRRLARTHQEGAKT